MYQCIIVLWWPVVGVNWLTLFKEGSVSGLLLFLLDASEFFIILENRLIGYADDSTLFSVVLSTGVRVAVAESPNRDLGNFCVRCDLWGMKLNASKTETTIVSRPCTKHPHTHPINYWRNCAEGV